MIKVVFLVHRKPGLTEEEFSTYWRETHSRVCSLLPGLSKYVQNHGYSVESTRTGSSPDLAAGCRFS